MRMREDILAIAAKVKCRLACAVKSGGHWNAIRHLRIFHRLSLFILSSYSPVQLGVRRRFQKEIVMDRRAFVLGFLGVAAASATLVAGIGEVQAAPLPVAKPDGLDEANRLESDFRPEVDGEAKAEDAQFYYYRRPRRVYYRRRIRRRRVYYRPRRVIYRRRYYRRRYYW
jgi:hypothetical protein